MVQAWIPANSQLFVDGLAGDVHVLDVEDDEVSLLGDLKDELDDPLHFQRGQVGRQLEVVADRTDENGQPEEKSIIDQNLIYFFLSLI